MKKTEREKVKNGGKLPTSLIRTRARTQTCKERKGGKGNN